MLTFIMGLKGAQLILVALVVLLLFGSARIPSIMRNIGKGIHGFKQGLEDAKAEINKDVDRPAASAEKPAPQDPDKANG